MACCLKAPGHQAAHARLLTYYCKVSNISAPNPQTQLKCANSAHVITPRHLQGATEFKLTWDATCYVYDYDLFHQLFSLCGLYIYVNENL